MTKKQEKELLIRKLADNESLISELYDLYGQQFENKLFWINLSTEEKLHFEWIKSFDKYSKLFEITIDDFRLTIPKVDECISIVKRMIFNAKETSIHQAFKNALLIEANLAEENYFSIFKSTRSSIMNILKQLESDTHRHINLIKAESKRSK